MHKVTIYNPAGGTEGHSQEYTNNLCIGFAINGDDVDLITSNDFNCEEINKYNVATTFTNVVDSRKTTISHGNWIGNIRYGLFILKNNIRSFSVLSKALNQRERIICLLSGGETITNIIYILMNNWRRQTVYALTIHNADYDISLYKKEVIKRYYKLISKIFLRILLKTRTKVFVHGEAMQRALAKQLFIRPERLCIYKVPIRRKQVLVMKEVANREVIRFLFCGVMRYDKGFDILCEALSHIRDIENWEIRIAGSPRQVGKEYIERMIYSYGISDRCSLKLTYLTEEELASELIESDIVVLPYRRNFIAQSVVMTDAIKWNKLVVVTQHSQNGYDASKYGVGWTFESEDAEDLSKTLRESIKQCRMNPFGTKGFERYLLDHSPQEVASSIIRQI